MQNDCITRILCEDYNIHMYTATTHRLVRHCLRIHEAAPCTSIVFGRAINAATLLSATLKPDSNQSITYKISGTGKIREIHIQADARGNIRGYVANPSADYDIDGDEITPSRLLGAGFLSVTRDLGLKEPYSGIIPLRTGDIAMDTAYYLKESEQTPSAIILGMHFESDGKLSASGGILIQPFPDADESALIEIEHTISSLKKPLGASLKDGIDIVSYASEIVGNVPLEILATTPVSFNCRCGREMLLNILKSMHKDELRDMLEKDHGIEITCSFCMEKYYFGENDIAAFL